MKEDCVHDLKTLYFRKKVKGEYLQGWTRVRGYKICNNCLKVFKEENKEVKE